MNRASPLLAMEILEILKQDFSSHPHGTFFLAHVLLPHYPYIYTPECGIKPPAEWQYNLSGIPKSNRDVIQKTKEAAYLDQVLCTHRTLEGLFTSLKETAVFKESIILIMGDHGSRIMVDTLGPGKGAPLRDNLSSFSALFLIKESQKSNPGDGRLHEEKVSIAKLINDYFHLAPSDTELEKEFENVYLQVEKDAKFHPQKMVDF